MSSNLALPSPALDAVAAFAGGSGKSVLNSSATTTKSATWVFGYGSIIWRPDFEYAEKRLGWVNEHTRRFWQGSPDHRGQPGALGRVLTLVPEAGSQCWGVCYRLPEDKEDDIMAALDYRERGGYVRIDVPFEFETSPGSNQIVRVNAITYIASPDNQYYLGPAPMDDLVRQIYFARGESGKNIDYVLNLARHLETMGLHDEHIQSLALHLERRAGKDTVSVQVETTVKSQATTQVIA